MVLPPRASGGNRSSDAGEGVTPSVGQRDDPGSHSGLPAPVGVVVEAVEHCALRTDEPLAEHVAAVAAHSADGAGRKGELEPAGRLAVRADAVCRVAVAG